MKTRRFRIIFLALLLLIPSFEVFSQTEESAKILDQFGPGIISLVAYDGNEEEIARASGFIWNDEIIVTSYHSISQAVNVEGFNSKGKKVKVEGILGVDKNFDIAFLKIKGKLGAVTIGDSDALAPGNRIFAIGANEADEITVSEGTVRDLLQLEAGRKVIDPSLSVPDSYSGGSVLNLNGEIVGMVNVLARGLKVVIPVNWMKNISLQAKHTSFKDWAHEQYLELTEGAYLAGRLYALIDDTGGAQRYLEKVVKVNPNLIEAQSLLASVYNKQRDFRAAVSAYKKVKELDPGRIGVDYNLGLIYIKLQQYDDAVASLEKAIQFEPSNKEAYFYIGNAHEEKRDFARAAEAYERYLGLNPETSWTGYLRLGLSRMELQEYDKAVAALQEALKEQPRDVKILYTLAQAYQKAGLLDDAAQTYQTLTEMSPDDALSYYGMIVKMYDEGKAYEKAIEAAKKVIELSPNSEMAVYNLAIMYQKLERFQEAIDTFNQALAIKPDFDYAYYNIGFSYAKMKKHAESIEAFKKYSEISPDSPDGWFNIGIGYMQLKKFDQALEPMRKAVELRPDYGPALYNLGIVYLNLRDNYSAKDVCDKLAAVDPDLAQRLKKLIR